MLPLPKWSDWCHWIFHSQWKQSVLRLRPCYRSFSLLGVVLPSVAQTWSPSFLRVGTEKGARPRVNQSTVLLWPDIQALEGTSPFGAACISPIMTPSYSLKRVLVLLIMFNIVSESTMCNTLSKLNLISFSMTFLPRLDKTTAFMQFHLGGGQFVHWGNTTLCPNKTTPVVTIVKLPSDVGYKNIGEITSITKDEQPWLTNWVWWS